MSADSIENAPEVTSYMGNPLMTPLGKIEPDKVLMKRLTKELAAIRNIELMEPYIREYEVQVIRDLRVPCPVIFRIARGIDQIIREGYRKRDPNKAKTWTMLYEGIEVPAPTADSMCGGLFGPSGSGKTQGVHISLEEYPQVYVHSSFPRLKNGLKQIVWLYVQVPATGKLHDLNVALVDATAIALKDMKIKEFLAPIKNDPVGSFERWSQFVASHFLGILVLDEIQNLFKLASLKERSKAKNPELRIADDTTLKCLLNFVNMAGIPLLVSGTPDAKVAISKRFSTIQRLIAGNTFEFQVSSDSSCPLFQKLLKGLVKYQWSDTPISEKEIADVIFLCTAGIRRLVVIHWISAHKIMAQRNGRSLIKSDFEKAAKTAMKIPAQAVEALRSGRPEAIRKYEDLMAEYADSV